MTIRVQIFGADRVDRMLRHYTKKGAKAVAEAMRVTAEDIMDEADPRSPIQTGKLRRSAYVTDPRRAGSAPMVEAGYGADYAMIVHERSEAAYRTGEPKWLERTMDEWAGRRALDRLTRATADVLKGKGAPARRYPAHASKG